MRPGGRERAHTEAAIAGADCACALPIQEEGPLGTISVRFNSSSTTTVFPDDTAPSTVRGVVVSTHAQKFEPFSRRKLRYLSQADSVESFWRT